MQSKYFAQLAALSALWGATFLFTRIATPELGPALTATGRVGLGAITLGVIMHFMRYRWPRGHWRELFLLGATGIAGPHLLYSWSSLHLPAGYSAVLSVTSVLFGSFAAAWLKEDALTWPKLLGCLLAFVGVTLVVRLGPITPSPILVTAALVAIAGSALAGCSTPLLKRATTRMEPLTLTAAIHVTAFILLLPGALWTLPSANFAPSALAAVAVMGIATSGLAYWQYMRIVQKVRPIAALSSTFMTTISGVIWGHVFLGESFTAASYAGGLLVLAATVLVTGFNPLRRALDTDPAKT